MKIPFIYKLKTTKEIKNGEGKKEQGEKRQGKGKREEGKRERGKGKKGQWKGKERKGNKSRKRRKEREQLRRISLSEKGGSSGVRNPSKML